MNRILCTLLLIGLCQCATVAKGKVKKAPDACPPCNAAPTPSHALLEDLVLKMFNYTESGDFEAAASMFKPGMDYLTNGQRYDIDLSTPDAIKSIPYRTRKNFIFNTLDDHEIWAHCVVEYPDGLTNPEMLIVHFDDSGLIDLFSHVEPKGVQCSAIVKPVVATKLALRLVNGTIIDAPQEQLEAMLEEQQRAAAAAAAAAGNSTGSNSTSSNATSSNATSSNSTSSNSTSSNSTAPSQRTTTTVTTSNTTTSSNTTAAPEASSGGKGKSKPGKS
jgi:hypothetical protein